MPEPEIFILLVEVGRSQDDGLPDDATGAAFLCYATGADERDAVNETVAVFRQAGLSPLEVESYGTGSEPEGIEIGAEERALMNRARTENAVIVASVEHFTEEAS